MYHSEVSVSQEELKSFLSVAEDLRGKGLTQNQSGSQSTRKENDFKSTFTPKQNPPRERAYVPPKRVNPVPHPLPLPSHPATIDDDDILEVMPVKSQPGDPALQPILPVSQDVYQAAEPFYPQLCQALVAEDDYDQATAAVYQEEGYENYQQDVNPDNADVESLMAKLDDGTGYMCLVCNSLSAMQSNLKKHIEGTHLQYEPQDCSPCGRTCKKKNTLQNHMSLSHRLSILL